MNSIIYTNPTVILALSAKPLTNRQAYVIYKLDEHNRIIVATSWVDKPPTIIHLRPNLSASIGIKSNVMIQPIKVQLPIRPIASLLTHSSESCSTQLWRLYFELQSTRCSIVESEQNVSLLHSNHCCWS